MSQPKRFEVQLHEMGASIFPHYAGRFVEYSDYANLAAENERLRKAGEMLFECIEPDIDDIGYNYGFKHKHAEARDTWLAAKEGRDAK